MININKVSSYKKILDKYILNPQKHNLFKFQMSLNIENRISNLRSVINENDVRLCLLLIVFTSK